MKKLNVTWKAIGAVVVAVGGLLFAGLAWRSSEESNRIAREAIERAGPVVEIIGGAEVLGEGLWTCYDRYPVRRYAGLATVSLTLLFTNRGGQPTSLVDVTATEKSDRSTNRPLEWIVVGYGQSVNYAEPIPVGSGQTLRMPFGAYAKIAMANADPEEVRRVQEWAGSRSATLTFDFRFSHGQRVNYDVRLEGTEAEAEPIGTPLSPPTVGLTGGSVSAFQECSHYIEGFRK